MKIKIRILNLTIFVFVLSYFSAGVLFAQNGVNKVRTYNSGSVVTDSTMLNDSKSSNARELYNSYGKESECACGSWDNDGKCTKYLNNFERKLCRERYQYGGAGTFKVSGELVVGGDMILNGHDGLGNHWIKSGTQEGVENVVGFGEEGELLANNNIFIGDSLTTTDLEADILFGEGTGDKIEFTKWGTNPVGEEMSSQSNDCTGVHDCIPAVQLYMDGASALNLYFYNSGDDTAIRSGQLTTAITTLKTDHAYFKLSEDEINYMKHNDFSYDEVDYHLLSPDNIVE